jgi:hypothetical protein
VTAQYLSEVNMCTVFVFLHKNEEDYQIISKKKKKYIIIVESGELFAPLGLESAMSV